MKLMRSMFDSLFVLMFVMVALLVLSTQARAESPFMELKKGLSFTWGDITRPAYIFGGIGKIGGASTVVSGPCTDTMIDMNLNGKRAGGIVAFCGLVGGTTDEIRHPNLAKIGGVKGDISIFSFGIGRDVNRGKWVPFFGASVQF